MADMQEIAVSNNYICPSQESVDLLRRAQNDESIRGLFGDSDINNFTIYTVPNRVVEILAKLDSELYWSIASKEITPMGLLKIAQMKYDDQENQKINHTSLTQVESE
jgi:hypothetical protein